MELKNSYDAINFVITQDMRNELNTGRSKWIYQQIQIGSQHGQRKSGQKVMKAARIVKDGWLTRLLEPTEKQKYMYVYPQVLRQCLTIDEDVRYIANCRASCSCSKVRA